MSGDEPRVVAAFCDYLRAASWQVETEVKHADVVAKRDGVTLYAEAKGQTTDPGLDVDTAFGQLLRRTLPVDDPSVRYALVVPDHVVPKVQWVPAWVRELLRVDLYAVGDDDAVRQVPD